MERERERERETCFCKSTFIRALFEHLFQDFEPCWIIINNKNTKTDRKHIASRRREAIFHDDGAVEEDERGENEQ